MKLFTTFSKDFIKRQLLVVAFIFSHQILLYRILVFFLTQFLVVFLKMCMCAHFFLFRKLVDEWVFSDCHIEQLLYVNQLFSKF